MTALSQDQFHSGVLDGQDTSGKSYEWVKKGVEGSKEFKGLFNDITKNFADTTEDIVARATIVLSELQNKKYAEIRNACGNGTCYTYALQILLASRSYFGNQTEVIDGILGPQTKEAVKQFQTTYNKTHIPLLDVDGLAGPATITALLKTAPATATVAAEAEETPIEIEEAEAEETPIEIEEAEEDMNTKIQQIYERYKIPKDMLKQCHDILKKKTNIDFLQTLLDKNTEIILVDNNNRIFKYAEKEKNSTDQYIQIEYTQKNKILYQGDMKLKGDAYLADGEGIEYNLKDDAAYYSYSCDRQDGKQKDGSIDIVLAPNEDIRATIQNGSIVGLQRYLGSDYEGGIYIQKINPPVQISNITKKNIDERKTNFNNENSANRLPTTETVKSQNEIAANLNSIQSKFNIPMNILQKCIDVYSFDPEGLIKRLKNGKAIVKDEGNDNWIVGYTDDDNKQNYIQIENAPDKMMYNGEMTLTNGKYLANGWGSEYNLNDDAAYYRIHARRKNGFPEDGNTCDILVKDTANTMKRIKCVVEGGNIVGITKDDATTYTLNPPVLFSNITKKNIDERLPHSSDR